MTTFSSSCFLTSLTFVCCPLLLFFFFFFNGHTSIKTIPLKLLACLSIFFIHLSKKKKHSDKDKNEKFTKTWLSQNPKPNIFTVIRMTRSKINQCLVPSQTSQIKRASIFEVIQHQQHQIRHWRNWLIRYWTDGADPLHPHSVVGGGRFWWLETVCRIRLIHYNSSCGWDKNDSGLSWAFFFCSYWEEQCISRA